MAETQNENAMIFKMKLEPVEGAHKRAAKLEDLTDAELNAWEEQQREQRRKYRDHLRRKGML